MSARRNLQVRKRRRMQLELAGKIFRQQRRWVVKIDRKDGLVARRAREVR